MSRPLWLVRVIERAYPGRFLLARSTRLPLVGRVVEQLLFEGDDLLYLPRDRVVLVDQHIDPLEHTVLPSEVVEAFIAQASFRWIMDACICRNANHCQDYPIDLGCLFLGEAARGINPRLGRPVTRQQALEHARRCREAGLVHLIGRNKLDTVWLGVGPGDRLLTICNCCPCCCLWRVLPHVAPRIGARVNRMPGVTVTVSDRCVGCGTCTRDVCFVGAIRLAGDRAVIGDDCRGCGRCVEVCPEGAIELSISRTGFVEEAIARITPLVDLS